MQILNENIALQREADRVPLKAIWRLIKSTQLDMDESTFAAARSWAGIILLIRNNIANANMEASPGIPYGYCYKSNRDFISQCHDEIVLMTLATLVMRMECYHDLKRGIEYSALEKVEMGVQDTIRTFLKDEPTKKSKAAIDRWRMIWSVSLIDGLADETSLLADKVHISKYWMVPMKPGLPTSQEHGAAHIVRTLFCGPDAGEIMSCDISHWDYLASWDLKLAQMIVRMGWVRSDIVESLYNDPFNCDDWVWAQLYMMADTHYHKVLVLSNGRAFEQLSHCIQPSGCKSTASDNSGMRNLVHYSVTDYDGDVDISYGDDWCGTYQPGEVEKLRRMGIVVKESSVLVSNNTAEFCSRSYTYNGDGTFSTRFLGVDKTLSGYLQNEPTQERRDALVLELGKLGAGLARVLPSFLSAGGGGQN